jgi:hypothetical protein
MLSLHDAHKMIAYRDDHVCLFRMIQLEKTWTDLDKFGMDVMAFGSNLESYFSVIISNTNMADERTCVVGLTLAPLALGQYNDVW